MQIIIGLLLIIAGFIFFRMSKEPLEKRPIFFDLGILTFILYSGLIISGLYILYRISLIYAITGFFLGAILAEIIRKLIWKDISFFKWLSLKDGE